MVESFLDTTVGDGSWTSCVFKNFTQEGTPSNYRNIFLKIMAPRHSRVHWLCTLDPVAQDFCRGESAVSEKRSLFPQKLILCLQRHNSWCTFLMSFFCVAFFFLCADSLCKEHELCNEVIEKSLQNMPGTPPHH